MYWLLRIACVVLGHHVVLVPFLHGTRRGEYAVCRRCERLDVRVQPTPPAP